MTTPCRKKVKHEGQEGSGVVQKTCEHGKTCNEAMVTCEMIPSKANILWPLCVK